MKFIALTFKPETHRGHKHGEMTAVVRSEGFAGRGAAWFSKAVITSFCASLEKFPLSAENPPVLEGGYWSEDGDQLEQCLLRIAITPDPLGQLQGHLLLSVLLDGDPLAEGHGVTACFSVDYASLQRFSADIQALIEGSVEEVRLNGF